MNNRTLHTLVWWAPAAMLLLALAPLPYGYYTLLRLIVFFAAGAIAFVEYTSHQRKGWALGFSFLAALFNPFVPVYLTRELWGPIDVVTAAIFVAHWFMIRRAKNAAL